MSDSTAKLQIRTDRELKDCADEVYSELGQDAATAVRMLFTKAAKTRSIPFKLKVEGESSPAAEARTLVAWEESKNLASLSRPFGTQK